MRSSFPLSESLGFHFCNMCVICPGVHEYFQVFHINREWDSKNNGHLNPYENWGITIPLYGYIPIMFIGGDLPLVQRHRCYTPNVVQL